MLIHWRFFNVETKLLLIATFENMYRPTYYFIQCLFNVYSTLTLEVEKLTI